jgi:hypothetical protein
LGIQQGKKEINMKYTDKLDDTLSFCRTQVKTYDKTIEEYVANIHRHTALQLVQVFAALLQRYDIRNHEVSIVAGMGSAFLKIGNRHLSDFRWGEYRADLLKGVSAAKALVAMEEYIGTELPWEISQYMDGKVLIIKQGGPGVNL